MLPRIILLSHWGGNWMDSNSSIHFKTDFDFFSHTMAQVSKSVADFNIPTENNCV